MMTKIIACDKCFAKIEKKSSKAAYVWLSLLEVFYEVNKKLILIKPFYYKDLRTLEMMKYILSTDLKDSVAIKVLGFDRKDETQFIFCGGQCEKKDM